MSSIREYEEKEVKAYTKLQKDLQKVTTRSTRSIRDLLFLYIVK